MNIHPSINNSNNNKINNSRLDRAFADTMDPTTPRCRRSRPRPVTTPREKRGSVTPSTPRFKSDDFFVSTPSTVHSDSINAFDDDFPFDSSGEWSAGVDKSSFQTPKRDVHTLRKEKLKQIQSCSPLVSPHQPEDKTIPRRPRRRMSTCTDHSNETNESNDSSKRSPRRRPRRTSSAVKLDEKFLVLSPPPPAEAIPETPRRARRSSSVEPRRRRTASIERRRTSGTELPPRRRLSMTKIGSASPQNSETLESPAARRLARHAQSMQQLSREKPPLLRQKSREEVHFDWPATPRR